MSYKYIVTDSAGTFTKTYDNLTDAARYVRDYAINRNEILLVFKSECVLSTNDFDLNAIRSNITKD